jgi:small-conductance mechanosensitive channel
MTPLLATTKDFFSENEDWLTALAFLVGSIIVAKIVDLYVGRNVKRVTARLKGDELSKAAVTRLRLIRRLISVTIILIGLGLALSQINALQPLATTLLASSAVIGVAVGLASRAVLANGVSGLMLASVQPFRIGDVIEWNGSRGRVEDLTLTYTFVRLPSGHQLIIPNEAIATSSVENFTIAGSAVDADASVWVLPQRATGALKLLRDKLEDTDVNLGECEADRIELKLGFSVSAQAEASRRFSTREQAVAILSDAGMLDPLPALG